MFLKKCLSLLRSRLVTVGRVRTMASVPQCTRKTAICVFAKIDLREQIAKKVGHPKNARRATLLQAWPQTM